MDSVNETFQGSQVQLAAPKDYQFMHWTPWGRAWNGRGEFGPACERIRVTGVVTVVCQASPANHQPILLAKPRMYGNHNRSVACCQRSIISAFPQ